MTATCVEVSGTQDSRRSLHLSEVKPCIIQRPRLVSVSYFTWLALKSPCREKGNHAVRIASYCDLRWSIRHAKLASKSPSQWGKTVHYSKAATSFRVVFHVTCVEVSMSGEEKPYSTNSQVLVTCVEIPLSIYMEVTTSINRIANDRALRWSIHLEKGNCINRDFEQRMRFKHDCHLRGDFWWNFVVAISAYLWSLEPDQ